MTPRASASHKDRNEICRFEHDRLLYRIYFFENGEIIFTVTGDPIRLGLITKEDLRWDCSFDLPTSDETSLLVNLHAYPGAILRTVALRIAQYMAKHQPMFFYYKVEDDRRRHRLYIRLLQRHPEIARLYDMTWDESSRYAMFVHK